jgi:hypothetical protein
VEQSSTAITALFDIGRDSKGDGRTIDQYLDWFDKTLRLNVPFIIYTEDRFKEFILQRRDMSNTSIIIQKLEDVPYYQYKNQIENILKSPSYRQLIKDPSRIECNLSLYNIIQYSKFEWLVDAIDKHNQYDYYFWMDAGCSRFFDNIDTSISWPQNYSILKQDRLNIQGNINTVKYYQSWPGDNVYIWDNNCLLVGTLFGGSSIVCKNIATKIKSLFEFYLNQDIVNNEQILLAILFKNNPGLFSIHIELNNKHLPYFSALSYQ